ncbi:MAG: biotin--[acetyl-CoA-carboxylase] ligase [Geodermatophilaceae bacterium]
MYADLSRPPLDAAAVSRAVVYDGSLWRSLRVVASTGSTNADLAGAARDGAREGCVLVAEEQTSGRGRLDRVWTSPAQAGLTFSVLLRPPSDIPVSRWGWLPLLAGVAVAEAVRGRTGVATRLKWPNDLLLGEQRRKAAGVLAEVVDDAVVIGIGLNVSTRAEELPEGATSLTVEGAASADRDPILRAILREIESRYRTWCGALGDAVAGGLLTAYVEVCDTLGREVSVMVPSGGRIGGRAEAIDSTGRLVIRTGFEVHAMATGDVTHVR